MNYQNSIERSIISSLLQNEEYLCEKAFEVEEKYFMHPFHKQLVTRLTDRFKRGESVSLLNKRIIQYFNDRSTDEKELYLNIISTAPLPLKVANQYYEELKILQKMNKLKGIK